MATNFETRLADLERLLLPPAATLCVIDARDGADTHARADAYEAETPESKRAQYVVIIDDPTRR